MTKITRTLSVLSALVLGPVAACAPMPQPVAPRPNEPVSELWSAPPDVASQDLFNGPWGADRAPRPDAVYTFVRRKEQGTNPGIIVRDPEGREWHVKQPIDSDEGDEGPVEVVLSRVLSAVGYHQPPVYYSKALSLAEGSSTRVVAGGRFRLAARDLKDRGGWSWQQNPFVGTRPFEGLMAMLMVFNCTDLKNDNNSIYEWRRPGGGSERWFVVRDLGSALGETGRLAPRRGDARLFARERFISGVKDGFVEFGFHGWHQELVRRQITPGDVRWAAQWLGKLSDQQWLDAFRAGGFSAAAADPFIRRIHEKLAEGMRLDRP